MRKIITILSAMLAVATACQKHYELNTDFAMPTSLSSPSSVTLDVTSSSTVQLAWTGGGSQEPLWDGQDAYNSTSDVTPTGYYIRKWWECCSTRRAATSPSP